MNMLKNLSRAALIASVSVFSVPVVGMAQTAETVEAAPEAAARAGRSARRGGRANRGRANRGHANRGHRGRGGHLMRQLDLSDNQKAQIRAIRQSARAARTANVDEAARRAARTESRRLMMEVLTPAQRTQLDTLKANRRAERMNHRIERMTERLSLSAGQVSRITAIFESAAETRSSTLGRMEGEERRAAAEDLRASTLRAVEAVLTPTQREAAETHRAERRSERAVRRGVRGENGERGERSRRGRRGGARGAR